MRLSAYVVVCLSLSWIVTLTGCGGSIGSTPPPSNHTAPTITAQPANKAVAPGQTATFSATATGTTPLTYQWEKNQSAISGATSASYTTPAVSTTDNGAKFRVVVSNSMGSATSNPATLTVSSTAPTITTQPANKTVAPGGTATFSVTAAGSAPLTYEWQKDQVAISGATSASYTTPAAPEATPAFAPSQTRSGSSKLARSRPSLALQIPRGERRYHRPPPPPPPPPPSLSSLLPPAPPPPRARVRRDGGWRRC